MPVLTLDDTFTSEVYLTIDGKILSKVNVDWKLEIEYRSWGVKELCAYVPLQTIKYEEDVEDEHDYHTETKTIEVKDAAIDMADRMEFPLKPQDLVLFEGKWTLEF